MTLIKIENLRMRTVVGVFEWEKKILQDVIVNVEMEIDCPDPESISDLSETVDYKKISKKIIGLVEGGKFDLIETIAGKIAEAVLADNKVRKTAVSVGKPGALRFADSVSLTYTAEQK